MKNLDMARDKISNETNNKPSKSSGPSLIILSAGFFIIAITALLLIYFKGSGNKAPDDNIRAINARLAQIDKRLSTIEDREESLALIDEQRTKLEISLMDRIEGMEALIDLRQDADSEAPDTLHSEAIENKASTETLSGKSNGEEAEIHYHQVQPGETLYRISLKYGISVDELRKLNNISPEAVIFIGQRLIVSGDKE